MERYGRDYGRGRWDRPGFRGYDEEFSVGYAGSPGYRTPPNRNVWGARHDRQRAWDEFGEGHERWAREGFDPRFARGEPSRSDQGNWGSRQPRWVRHGYDDDYGSGTGRYGYSSGGRHFRGRQDEYDHDFMDRVRRGWHQFRDEARGWLNRGYDRGW